MSALLSTLAAFALILLLVRLKVPLAASIAAGAVAVGVTFGLPAGQLAKGLAEGLVQPRTVGLAVVTICLLALSGAMQAGGQMTRIVEATQALLRRPWVAMAALPAMIGLLPMPGGALFSAPMVAEVAGDQYVPPGKLSAINYWFRHIWEYWWPMYPGVILAVTLTGMDLATFVRFQMPLSLAMIAGGLLILRRMHPNLHIVAPPGPRGTKRKLLRATAPIWLTLMVWAAVRAVLVFTFSRGEAGQSDMITAVHSYLPITVGLIVGVLSICRAGNLSAGAIRKIWSDGRSWKMVLVVVSVMVFQHMLHRVSGPSLIAEELRALRFPLPVVVAALPFIAGMVTGIAVGFVGTSFPIVMGLVTVAGAPVGPYVVLAYAAGHLGQMLSPIHVCHIVSNNYFKTDYAPVYRHIVPAAAVTAVLVLGYFAVLVLL